MVTPSVRRSRSRWCTAVAGLLVLFAANTSVAQATGQSADPDGNTAWPSLSKGTYMWGPIGNVGVAHDLFGATSDREFVSAGLRIGRIVTKPRGPGFLRGRFSVHVELFPLFVMFQDPSTYGFMFSLLGKQYLETGGRVRPFIAAGAGLLVSGRDIPEDTTRVNFTPQIGFGIAVPDSGRWLYTIEYRFHHISNANTADRNPGINSSFVQLGVSLVR